MAEIGSPDHHIAAEDIRFHPASYADDHGRVFLRNGEVFRAIDSGWRDFVESLLKTRTFRSLVSDGLVIETEPTSFSLPGYPLVVQHRRLDVVSYPFEWCFDALKDAALLILALQERLLAEGLTLQDAHPWNVMFDGCRPIFVDLGSIMPGTATGSWSALEQFRHYVVNPLILMAWGHSKIAHAIFYRDQGISDQELISLTPQHAPRESWMSMLRKETKRFSSRERPETDLPLTKVLGQLRNKIEQLSFPNARTEWSTYYGEFPPLDSRAYANLKQQGTLRVLQAIKPKSILDAASNRGWYSELAATRLGCSVISFDVDEPSIIQLFCDGKREHFTVHPLIMDLSKPSAGLGPLARTFAPAFERFRSEMVLALAIVHHLVFKRLMRFEQIAETLAAFSNRWLLVEFVPKEDKYVSEWWSEKYAWYTLANFKTELSRYFSRIETIDSDPAPRVLLLCEI